MEKLNIQMFAEGEETKDPVQTPEEEDTCSKWWL